jgi:hypothetical protein
MLAQAGFAIVWDGLGSTPPTIRVTDPVPAVSLGLPRQAAPPAEARPAPADLSATPALAEPAAVTLPASMEAAIR